MRNILLITADDLDAQSLARFGGPPEVTPVLNAFAEESTTFHRAHVVVAVCQPSRSAIMTGKLPHRNGAEGFEAVHDGVLLLTDLLRERGYRNGIIGKVEHLAPLERFGWDAAWWRDELGEGRSPARYGAAAAEFIGDAVAAGRPWFLMANTHDPHRPWHGSEQEQKMFSGEQLAEIDDPSRTFEPGECPTPDFLPDLDDVRADYAQYLGSARRGDDAVGAVLGALEASGEADDTIVVFLSDNGFSFPFAKANCYLRSTRTPLVIRWPGVAPEGIDVEDSFVSSLDIFPTLCEAVGIEAPDDLDGSSLVPILRKERQGRDLMFTVFHETRAGRRYEMRCVQDERYGYIWNQWSNGLDEYAAENMSGLSWRAMVDAAAHDPVLAARTDFYRTRVPDELYDLGSDPASLLNLAHDADHADHLGRLRRALAAWMVENQDPLLAQFERHLLGAGVR